MNSATPSSPLELLRRLDAESVKTMAFALYLS